MGQGREIGPRKESLTEDSDEARRKLGRMASPEMDHVVILTSTFWTMRKHVSDIYRGSVVSVVTVAGAKTPSYRILRWLQGNRTQRSHHFPLLFPWWPQLCDMRGFWGEGNWSRNWSGSTFWGKWLPCWIGTQRPSSWCHPLPTTSIKALGKGNCLSSLNPDTHEFSPWELLGQPLVLGPQGIYGCGL